MDNLNENEVLLLGTSQKGDVSLDTDVEIIDIEDDTEEVLINGRTRRIVRRKPREQRVRIERGANRRRTQVLERIGQLKDETKTALLEGKKQISDKILYSKVALAEMKDGHLIVTDGGTSTGVRNLSNGKYSNDFLLQAIQLVYDETATNGEYTADLPKEIVNGELSVTNNGKTFIEDLPIMHMATLNGYPIDKHFNIYKLNNPKWFNANTDIQINLSMVSALTTGFVKVLLIGTEVRSY